MVLPISEYYLYPPKKSTKIYKKELNASLLNQQYREQPYEQSVDENSTPEPTIATTPEYDELSFMSSSSSSSPSIDHSNSNHI